VKKQKYDRAHLEKIISFTPGFSPVTEIKLSLGTVLTVFLKVLSVIGVRLLGDKHRRKSFLADKHICTKKTVKTVPSFLVAQITGLKPGENERNTS